MGKHNESEYGFTTDSTWIAPGAMDRIKNFAYSRNFTVEEVIDTVTASPVAWDAIVNYRF